MSSIISIILTSCLLPSLISATCSSFVPLGTANYTTLIPYSLNNSVNIAISNSATCAGPQNCTFGGNGQPSILQANTTFLQVTIGGTITDNRTLAFPTSTENTTGAYTINTTLPSDVQTSLFSLISSASNLTFTPSITTTQTGSFYFGLFPGQTGYVVFQPWHKVRRDDDDVAVLVESNLSSQCVRGLLQGCSGDGYQNGPIEACTPQMNPNDCNGMDCILGNVADVTFPSNQTTSVTPTSSATPTASAKSAGVLAQGLSGAFFGVVMSMSLGVALVF